MKTKNIFKMLAFALLMPAMLLTTACSNQDDVVNNTAENTVTSKGYALPVTVNVTRQADGTRATFDGSKLNFSDGDKLFVYGSATAAGSFAGELTWQSGGTFSGTIYTQNKWTGAADALFTAANEVTATLLPNGYDANSFLSIDNKNTTDIAYDDRLTVSGSNAFVASETAKATGVEQLSLEQASTYSSGFALSPGNAILNFTITGLAAGAKDVSLRIHHGFDYDVTGSVTPNASGVATFAIGVPVGSNISSNMENNLTVGSSNFTLPSSTTFAVGKIYNITRSASGTPTPDPAYTMPANATAGDVGKLICTDGHIHAYGADADCTKVRVAKIFYVGSDNGEPAPYNHGLALALTDESSSRMNWNDAMTACNAKNTSVAVESATWLLPSSIQWEMMGATSSYYSSAYENLRDDFTSVEGSNLKYDTEWVGYWSSTENDGLPGYAWVFFFDKGLWYGANDNQLVRACLAF